jgi:hypothetical protein
MIDFIAKIIDLIKLISANCYNICSVCEKNSNFAD